MVRRLRFGLCLSQYPFRIFDFVPGLHPSGHDGAHDCRGDPCAGGIPPRVGGYSASLSGCGVRFRPAASLRISSRNFEGGTPVSLKKLL